MKHQNVCIARTSFYDRAPMLKLSLEYQQQVKNNEDYHTYVFIDPHPSNGYSIEYDNIITKDYTRINWANNQGKYCWYNAINYLFENTSIEYVISIEDDIIVSYDYLNLCQQIINDSILERYENILYFHIGALGKPRGNKNKVVRSQACSRSILISRSKFLIIKQYIEKQGIKVDNDNVIASLLTDYRMTTIAPEMNRSGHFGIYGWSSNRIHGNQNGKKTIFSDEVSFNQLYELLKCTCLNGQALYTLNNNQVKEYFWDFDPNINFENLIYEI
jgi:hypothetical protein